MHIQIDALGGVAGDMFVASLLDAFPQFEAEVIASVEMAAPVRCQLLPHNDGVLQGRRFCVELRSDWAYDHAPDQHGHSGLSHDLNEHAGAAHTHRHWSHIKADLKRTGLAEDIRAGAIAIFEHLASAEARVHGIDIDEVAFHEVGAWDSIADIVAASCLIAKVGAASWSVGLLPLGSGLIQTAHGLLPVPAPATALLMRGFKTVDDGIGGERVTPTGAAILRYLVGRERTTPIHPRVLGPAGIGFGTRKLPGISNCLRVLVFDEGETGTSTSHRELAVIEFEVDDQSAEDLAMGLDRLRAHDDVFDVVQMPVLGKKGRMMTAVRVLARANANDAVAACFRETTTIGLRHHVVSGSALPRRLSTVQVEGRSVRVKTVERPGGRTAKAESDDALAQETHAARAALRRDAERLALENDAAS